MERIAHTVRAWRRHHDLTQKELAKHVGRGEGAVSKYERNRTVPPTEVLAAMAVVFGCTTDDLLNGRLPGERPIPADPDSVVVSLRSRLHQHRSAFGNAETVGDPPTRTLPIRGSVPGGDPFDAEDESEASFRCREEDWERAEFVLRVHGDSMSPTFLDGDWLAFTTKREPRTGDYVCALVASATTFKEFRIVQGRPLLMPLNGHYDPILDGFAVQGIYVWMHRDA